MKSELSECNNNDNLIIKHACGSVNVPATQRSNLCYCVFSRLHNYMCDFCGEGQNKQGREGFVSLSCHLHKVHFSWSNTVDLDPPTGCILLLQKCIPMSNGKERSVMGHGLCISVLFFALGCGDCGGMHWQCGVTRFKNSSKLNFDITWCYIYIYISQWGSSLNIKIQSSTHSTLSLRHSVRLTLITLPTRTLWCTFLPPFLAPSHPCQYA